MPDFRFQQLAIVVVAKNHNPTILNPDFLIRNEIIPKEWETSDNPVCTDPVAQVAFTSGVTITAEFNKIVFTEKTLGRAPEDISVPEIAQRYIRTLPHVAYKAIGINPDGIMLFEDPSAARSVIVDSLICSQRWQELSDEPIRGSLTLTIPLAEYQLKLSISEAHLEGEGGSALQVAGNFHYDSQAEDMYECNEELIDIIDKWDWCLSFFEDIVPLVKETN